MVQRGVERGAVQLRFRIAREPADDLGTIGIRFEARAERAHERGVRFPVDVLRWVERGEPLHGTPVTLRPRTCPSRLNTLPSFITNETLWRTWILSSGLPRTATISARFPTATVPMP